MQDFVPPINNDPFNTAVYSMVDKDYTVLRIHINSINNIISSLRSDLGHNIYKHHGLSDFDKNLAIDLLTSARNILQNATGDIGSKEEGVSNVFGGKYCRYVTIVNPIEDRLTEYKWSLIDYSNNITGTDLNIPLNGCVYVPNGLPFASSETVGKLYVTDNMIHKEK